MDESKLKRRGPSIKARPLLRSAALAVVAVNVAACAEERKQEVVGNPKGSWYDAGAGGASGAGGQGGFSGSTSNPKSSWYDDGLAGHDAGDDDAGDDDAGPK